MNRSAENEFVLQVLRSFLGDSPLSFNRWDRLDWKGLLSLARNQNLVPIFQHVFSRQEPSINIPHPIREELQEGFFEQAARALHYEAFLKEILACFQGMEIPCILFKGPSMAFEFYPRVELRPYHDLDVLIREGDYDRTREALSGLGCRMIKPEREIIRRKYFNSVNFLKPGVQEIALDLHWETLMISWNSRPFLRGREVWENIRWFRHLDLKLPVLQPEILVPYLCLHLCFHHQFGDLLSLCDLDLVIKKFGSRLNWDEVVRWAKQTRIRKPVYFGLKLAVSLVGTKVPESVLDQLRQGRMEERLFYCENLIFRKEPLPVNKERFIKFMLIDDFEGKIKALLTFFKQMAHARGGTLES